MFMSTITNATIAASAIGGVMQPGVPPQCIYVLDSSNTSATLSVSNGITANIGCGVYVNSSNGTAASFTGGANFTIASGFNLSVVGNYTVNNGAVLTATKKTGQTAISDPLSTLAVPTPASCSSYPTNYGNGGASITFSPGTYCNGINVGNGETVVFNKGNYIVTGGGITFGGGATITSQTGGVMFYNTGTTTGGSPTFQPVNIANGTNVTLTAPNSGTYQGILFYQDRTIPTTETGPTFGGGANMNLNGTLYFKTGNMTFANGTNSTVTALICNHLTFAGGAKITYDSTGKLTGLATGSASALLMQ